MDKYRQERVKRLQKYVSEQGLDAMLYDGHAVSLW